MMRVCVCDDDVLLCHKLSHDLEIYAFQNKVDMEITEHYDPSEIINQSPMYDVLFLDIRFGTEDSGYQVARTLRESNKEVTIIFLSSLRRYLPDGYKVQAFRYLLKPVQTQQLNETMDDLMVFLGAKQVSPFISVRSLAGRELVATEELILVESAPSVRLRNLYRQEGVVCTRESLKELYKKLPKDRFVPVHKCYIVHCKYVKNIHNNIICMQNGVRIPLGRSYKQEFWLRQNQYVHSGEAGK